MTSERAGTAAPPPMPAAPHAAVPPAGAGDPAREALARWLAHCERLHPTVIDMTLERTATVRDRLGLRFDVPVISVAGTNGKGSTCALIESIALAAGWRVGLYSKPHLVHFEERCRVGGASVDASALVPHFEAVEQARGDITLTWFEFTTLAILRLLSRAPLDLVVLEVGMGGRLDAVNAVDADVAVVTSVALDHTEYLGATREAIGAEKAGIFRAGRAAVIADPQPPSSVVAAAQALAADVWRVGHDYHVAGDRQQWRWWGRDGRRFHALAYPALRGANQLLNAGGAIAALEALRDRLPITAQAVRQGLSSVQLPGRFQIVPGQPTLVLDVAHNPQAVAALAANLDAMAYHPRTHAVFGAMRDKDIASLLAHMVPLVDAWHLTDLPLPRAAGADALAQAVREALDHARAGGAAVPHDVALSRHADPATALAAAVAAADPADRIVVFGSFYTVGGVLEAGLPRLAAPHVGAPAASPGAPVDGRVPPPVSSTS